jgi:hypothetical protein
MSVNDARGISVLLEVVSLVPNSDLTSTSEYVVTVNSDRSYYCIHTRGKARSFPIEEGQRPLLYFFRCSFHFQLLGQ